ncbi:hypothetical protein [Persicitalea sp.]|uniref:hypothetical protein n=1 Tax=Persicitalea sp. TaxID=3100273 RepID=UPI0035931405
MSTLSKILVLSLFAIFLSCEKPEDPDAGKPFIKSVSFKNLPAKDLKFDPARRTIIIRLPAVVPAEGYIPVLELSDNTEVIGGLTNTGALNITPACGCRGYDKPKPEGKLVLANDEYIRTYRTQRSYRVIFESPTAPLEPIGDLPITYSRRSPSDNFIEVALPLKNLHQNPGLWSIGLKNLDTGKGYGYNFALAGGQCVNTCKPSLPNRMIMWYDLRSGGGLPSGSYELSIQANAGGGDITFPQPFVYKE